MKSAVSLPQTPKLLPEHLVSLTLFSDVDASLILAKEGLAKCQKPDVIAGSFETPVNWWVAAELVYPDAKRILYQKDDSWLWVDGNEAEIGASKSKSVSTAGSQKNRKPDVVWETYRNFIFNDPNAEVLYLQNLRRSESNSLDDPEMPGKIEKSAQDGRLALRMIIEIKQKLNKGETREGVEGWISDSKETFPQRVYRSMQKVLEDECKFRDKKKSLALGNRDFRITLPQVGLHDGVHPQSLRAIAPSRRWEVYIDETGKNFTSQAQLLEETDNQLGRVIALVMPEKHGLAELDPGTHGTDLDNSKVQELLRKLIDSNVGVLGANLKADIQSHSWIASIAKLVRWALMMLPVSGQTEIVFKIEQRGSYSADSTLKVLEETMVDELRQLAPERFNKLQLSLELASKDDLYNGYVDVIANCWGSNDRIKKQMLKRTSWLGHCLMQSTHIAEIDRLYHRAARGLDADSWFNICTHMAREGGHSLFHDLLEELGERARQDASLWRRFLVESQRRIALKEFDAGSLERALSWLNRFKPHNAALPGLLRLQLSSAQLAAANHLGHYNLSHLSQTLALAKELEVESAPDACEAVLRVATSATNHFDFTAVVPYLEHWIEQPVAMPGLLNHGKLHSTLGQLSAFRGEHEQAIVYFDKANVCFQQLSDPMLSTRNQSQTMVYKTLVELDLNAPEVASTVLRFIDDATGVSGTPSIRKMARSAAAYRFEHYLLLRWLVADPGQQTVRDYYLTSSEGWQVGEGHPWMLINAYRGWLLVESDRSDEAGVYFQKAVDDCSEHEDSAILHWMAHCIQALGESLGTRLEPLLQECPIEPFPSEKLYMLRKASDTEERVAALNTLLPFNFH